MSQLAHPADQATPRYLDALAVARYLSLSLTFVRRLTSEKRIPFIALGRRRLYDRVQLDRWIQRKSVLPRGWQP